VRQIHFLSSAALIVTAPSRVVANKTRWRYSMDPCGLSFTTQELAIDETTLAADGPGANPHWCSNWTGAGFTAPAQPAVLSLRSAADPYVVAGNVTQCTFALPRPRKAIVESGLGWLLPGLVSSVVGYFFFAGICDLGTAPVRAEAAPLLRKTAAAPPAAAQPPAASYGGMELTAGRKPPQAPPVAAALPTDTFASSGAV